MGDLFIVATQEEERHAARLQGHLMPVARAVGLRVAVSTDITVGEERLEVLRRSVRGSRVVVLLVTATLLTSDEGEAAIEAAFDSGAAVVPVLLRACAWKVTVLGRRQWVPRDMVPIAGRSDPDPAWVEVAEAVMAMVSGARGARPESSIGPAQGEWGTLSDARGRSELRVIEDRLKDARTRRETLRGVPGTEMALRSVDLEILELRRKIRERGQLPVGETLANERYVLIEILGEGGFATVWKAHDRDTRSDVAVKVLHQHLARDEQRRERFFRGARVMASLQHPGIVRVIEAECHDRGFDYFVMELLRGGTLWDAVLQGRLSGTAIVDVLLQLGSALGVAHAAGHVHRDVKPANVLLDELGNPKLTDFDLVGGKHTTGGTRTGALGTFVYAAPEAMLRGQDADVGADVYGLGMTGVFCFYGRDLPLDVVRDAGRMIKGLKCSAEVEAALIRATEWSVEDRFPDVGSFCDALREPPDERFDGDESSAIRTRVRPVMVESTEGASSWVVHGKGDSLGAFASFSVGNVVQRMRWVPPGTFRMGSPEEERGRYENEGPPREVELTRGFWLADTPCIQALWQEVMGENPSRFVSRDRPVEQVSWEDCQAFLAVLNERVPGLAARLPTEAEWEHACRGGTETATWLGDIQILGANNAPMLDWIAWYGGNSGQGFEIDQGWSSHGWPEKQYPHTRAGTRPVGTKQSNPLGLFDMLGNVWEWCHDWYGSYASARAVDPTGPLAVSERVCRGGSWGSQASLVRAACRSGYPPNVRDSLIGFRVAVGPGPETEPPLRPGFEALTAGLRSGE